MDPQIVRHGGGWALGIVKSEGGKRFLAVWNGSKFCDDADLAEIFRTKRAARDRASRINYRILSATLPMAINADVQADATLPLEAGRGLRPPFKQRLDDDRRRCDAIEAALQFGTDAMAALVEDAFRPPQPVYEILAPAPQLAPTHSPDFRSINWFGRPFSFTTNQAQAVSKLWSAMENGTPEVSGAELTEHTSGRIADLFRDHPAWNTIIVRGATKGTRRLSTPEIQR